MATRTLFTRTLPLFLGITLLLAACTPAGAPTSPAATPLPATPAPTTPSPQPVEALARFLGVDVSEVEILSQTAVDWPNSCLGAAKAGEMCAEVITPGFIIRLAANGQTYEFHTDLTGSAVALASPPAPETGGAVFTWTQNAAGVCSTAQIRPDSVAFGACGGPLLESKFAQDLRAAELAELLAKYAPFEAETPAGAVEFDGQGPVTATPAEQRMVAEWARLVFQEAQGGRGGASWGLAFSWSREGGIAGFCDDLAVYVTGEVFATSCKGIAIRNLGRTWLTSFQLEWLYHLLDTYKNLEYLQGDPAVADKMTVELIFSGTGSPEMPAEELQALLDTASQMVFQMGLIPEPGDLQAARETLLAYFDLLHQGSYAEAATRFGGSYETLTGYNPNIPTEDHVALWRAGCQFNGLNCLPVKTIVHESMVGPAEFQFIVEFQNADGSLFVLGPCCGATPEEMPPLTQFAYTLVKADGRFLVQEMPVYTP